MNLACQGRAEESHWLESLTGGRIRIGGEIWGMHDDVGTGVGDASLFS